MDKDFEERLKELCIKYDAKAGHYPDPELVGLDLYKFYLHPEIDLSEYRTGNQYPEIDKEYVKNINSEHEQSNQDHDSTLPNFRIVYEFVEGEEAIQRRR